VRALAPKCAAASATEQKSIIASLHRTATLDGYERKKKNAKTHHYRTDGQTDAPL